MVQLRPQFGELTAYPDTLVGTDSHTTMINGLGVVGWGVGGIEAEAVMLGQPYFMLIPEVIGMKLVGAAPARHHGHRPGAHGHPDAPEEGRGRQVRRVLRARALRASDWPTGPPSPTWRPSTAPRWASSRWTPRRCATWSGPAAGRRVCERVERYCKEQGLFRTDATPGPRVHRHARARPRARSTPSLAGPQAAAGPGAAHGSSSGTSSSTCPA